MLTTDRIQELRCVIEDDPSDDGSREDLLAALDELIQFRLEPPLFVEGQHVIVNNPRYHGPGIVQYDSGVPRRRVIGVLLGNGNVWNYEVETVTLDPKEERRNNVESGENSRTARPR